MSNNKKDAHSLKEHNTNMVLGALMTMKTATRSQLAQKTGLSQPTVNSIVQELENKGYASPGTFAVSAGGRRPICYTLQTDHLRAVTIRVLLHSLEYVVVKVDGTVVLRHSWPIAEGDTHIAALQSLLRTLLKQDRNIRVVGIGVPGVVNPRGVLYAIPQIPELEGVALVRVLNKQLDIPIYVENDINLVALGSVIDESGQTTLSDMVFVHLGEGVGAGIVMGGCIIRGFSSFAGEIAYMVKPLGESKDGETLESLLAQTKEVAQQAKLIVGMIVSIICLLNPPVISFGSTLASEEMLWHLRHECEKHLPLWTLPSFKMTSDEAAAYDRGLMALVGDVLTNQIINELAITQ